MEIRDALLLQSPSLALQRAAADEIARLDALVRDMEDALQFAMPYLEAQLKAGCAGAAVAISMALDVVRQPPR